MKICILSDSHDHIALLNAAVADAKANGAAAVLHCGDVVAPSTLKCLTKHGLTVHLIHGNNSGDLYSLGQLAGKPENIIAKMVEGRLRKYYEEVVLLEQVWVIDGETKVGKVLEAAAKDLGGPVTVTGFARFNLGEGIDKGESDFAAEVQATLGG